MKQHLSPILITTRISSRSRKKSRTTGWRCRICGYVYEGEELPPDFICPLCKHGASDFEKTRFLGLISGVSGVIMFEKQEKR